MSKELDDCENIENNQLNGSSNPQLTANVTTNSAECSSQSNSLAHNATQQQILRPKNTSQFYLNY